VTESAASFAALAEVGIGDTQPGGGEEERGVGGMERSVGTDLFNELGAPGTFGAWQAGVVGKMGAWMGGVEAVSGVSETTLLPPSFKE
jgi:hypothetical protein